METFWSQPGGPPSSLPSPHPLPVDICMGDGQASPHSVATVFEDGGWGWGWGTVPLPQRQLGAMAQPWLRVGERVSGLDCSSGAFSPLHSSGVPPSLGKLHLGWVSQSPFIVMSYFLLPRASIFATREGHRGATLGRSSICPK